MAKGLKAIRYTMAAAIEGSSRFKSPTDNSPGKRFKDPQGVLHTVPDKRANRTGAKAKAPDKGSRLDLRNL